MKEKKKASSVAPFIVRRGWCRGCAIVRALKSALPSVQSRSRPARARRLSARSRRRRSGSSPAPDPRTWCGRCPTAKARLRPGGLAAARSPPHGQSAAASAGAPGGRCHQPDERGRGVAKRQACARVRNVVQRPGRPGGHGSGGCRRASALRRPWRRGDVGGSTGAGARSSARSSARPTAPTRAPPPLTDPVQLFFFFFGGMFKRNYRFMNLPS